MFQRILFPVMTGGFTPALVSVLGSVILLGSTVRGDSSSDSQNVTTDPPGALSVESRLNTAHPAELGALGGGESPKIGRFAGSNESIGTPGLTQAAPSNLTSLSLELLPVTDLPVAIDPDVRDEQPVTDSPDSTFPIAGLVRSLVMGTIGFLMMRRLQPRWKRGRATDRTKSFSLGDPMPALPGYSHKPRSV